MKRGITPSRDMAPGEIYPAPDGIGVVILTRTAEESAEYAALTERICDAVGRGADPDAPEVAALGKRMAELDDVRMRRLEGTQK